MRPGKGTKVLITEEVPGVSPEEAFFIYFSDDTEFEEAFEYFPTLQAAKDWCKEQGYLYRVDLMIFEFLDAEDIAEIRRQHEEGQ